MKGWGQDSFDTSMTDFELSIDDHLKCMLFETPPMEDGNMRQFTQSLFGNCVRRKTEHKLLSVTRPSLKGSIRSAATGLKKFIKPKNIPANDCQKHRHMMMESIDSAFLAEEDNSSPCKRQRLRKGYETLLLMRLRLRDWHMQMESIDSAFSTEEDGPCPCKEQRLRKGFETLMFMRLRLRAWTLSLTRNLHSTKKSPMIGYVAWAQTSNSFARTGPH